MSRKCPKRNQVFLNWLRENYSRFPFQPCVMMRRGKWINIELQGITAALSFSFSPTSGISVAAMLRGKYLDMIGDFDVAEKRTDKGWMCRLDLPEKRQYWRTREELWIKHCFEPFLEWCNRELVAANWLELYDGDGVTAAKLHKDRPVMDQYWDLLEEPVSNLETVDMPRIGKWATNALHTFIPLHKQMDAVEK